MGSPEPQVEEVAPPAPPVPQEEDVNKSFKKIHDKLKDETELYKLHLKHYHMTPKSFRHRTSALKLPKEVYDKYEEICKKCEHCQLKHTRPSRSRVSGLRANSFGDLVFIDHAEVKIGEHKYVVLIVVDAATSFLAAFPQKTMNSAETIDNLREWMELYQSTPKAICSDMAFTTGDFEVFLAMAAFLIKALGVTCESSESRLTSAKKSLRCALKSLTAASARFGHGVPGPVGIERMP